jgi:hypothetical protein
MIPCSVVLIWIVSLCVWRQDLRPWLSYVDQLPLARLLFTASVSLTIHVPSLIPANPSNSEEMPLGSERRGWHLEQCVVGKMLCCVSCIASGNVSANISNTTATIHNKTNKPNKQTPWSESASELYWPSDRRLSAKLVPTFADRGVPRGQRDGSLRPCSRFSRPEPLLLYQVGSQLYSRGWVDPVPDSLLLRESNPGLWICSQELWPLDHRGGQLFIMQTLNRSCIS